MRINRFWFSNIVQKHFGINENFSFKLHLALHGAFHSGEGGATGNKRHLRLCKLVGVYELESLAMFTKGRDYCTENRFYSKAIMLKNIVIGA